jgi:hypothetical protein
MQDGRLRDGAVPFQTCSTYGHHPNPKVLKRNYIGEIPVDDVPPTGQATLRVTPPRNHQRRGVRLVAAYEFARFDVL